MKELVWRFLEGLTMFAIIMLGGALSYMAVALAGKGILLLWELLTFLPSGTKWVGLGIFLLATLFGVFAMIKPPMFYNRRRYYK